MIPITSNAWFQRSLKHFRGHGLFTRTPWTDPGRCIDSVIDITNIRNVFLKHIPVMAAGFIAITINMDLSSSATTQFTQDSKCHLQFYQRTATGNFNTPNIHIISPYISHLWTSDPSISRKPRPNQNHFAGYCGHITGTLLMNTPMVRDYRV